MLFMEAGGGGIAKSGYYPSEVLLPNILFFFQRGGGGSMSILIIDISVKSRGKRSTNFSHQHADGTRSSPLLS